MSNFPFQRLQSELAVLISATPAGDRLPSEPQLSKKLGVSRATLREAMRTFETQGLIRRRQGAGTFVVGQVPVLDSGLEVLESLETMAQRLDLSVSVSDLHVERVYADQELAEGLKLPLASRLVSIRRVICADGRPVAYLVDTLAGKLPLSGRFTEGLQRFSPGLFDCSRYSVDHLASSDQRYRRYGRCGARARNPA